MRRSGRPRSDGWGLGTRGVLAVSIAGVVVGVLIGGGSAAITRIAGGFGLHSTGGGSGDPTYGSSAFYDSYALSYGPKSNENSNCLGQGVGTYESNPSPDSGVLKMYAGWNPAANSKCTSVYWYDQQWMGVHAGNYTPSSTGIYVLTENVTVDIYIQLFAACTSSTGNGASQPDFAEVNVSAFVAAWDNSYGTNAVLGTGPNMTSAYIFHLTTQDFPCSSGIINQNVTFNRTILSSSRLYLQSGNEYQFRAALELQDYVLSAYTGGTSYLASGQYNTYLTHTQINSVSVASG